MGGPPAGSEGGRGGGRSIRRAREVAMEYEWGEVLGNLAEAGVAANRAAVKVQE